MVPPPRATARMSRTAPFPAASGCCATGTRLSPAYPDARYWGQWTPSLAHLEVYRGRVLDATLSGLPITSGPIHDSRLVREWLAATPGFSFRVRAGAGARTPAPAAVFAIFDDHPPGIVLL